MICAVNSKFFIWLGIGWLCLMGAAAAVEPSEMLSDPVLEARAQVLDEQLRCVKCQSESIASSNADWARTARVLVRERLVAGDSDEEVIAWFVARYGDYVRMEPPFRGATLWLWLAVPIVFVLGALVVARVVMPRRMPAVNSGGAGPKLSAQEEARVAALTRNKGS